jgi:hypothetical protein
MWWLSAFLQMVYFFNPVAYQEMKQAGYACMVWAGSGAPTTPQPVCPYDPSNNNPGY